MRFDSVIEVLRVGFGRAGAVGTVPDVAGRGERERLLDLVTAHCLEHGVADLTLRRVAADVGTNNRMLLYYFTSKEGLIESALLHAVGRFPRVVGAIDLLHDRAAPLEERLARCWREISHPVNTPFMRLFFEVFGLAAHRPEPFRTYLDRAGHEWNARVEEVLVAEGLPRPDAALLGREIVALWRGLQFDLLSSGERDEIDRSHDRAATWISHRVRRAIGDRAGGGDGDAAAALRE
ncbi:TetR/AcrR family transcriptional regulator [Ilumatobacter sp.]|uniref:TetR/AcrR family transcriptional regulator n=1 Tax=Ilumatobacter sp. TaxID=1967498 RepID=UPI003B51D3BF